MTTRIGKDVLLPCVHRAMYIICTCILYLYKLWVRTAMQGIIEKLSRKANASEETQRFYNPPDAQTRRDEMIKRSRFKLRMQRSTPH